MFYENRLGIKKSVIGFVYLFCPNICTKFREPYHSSHLIPHRGNSPDNRRLKTTGEDVKISHLTYINNRCHVSLINRQACVYYACVTAYINNRCHVSLINRNSKMFNKKKKKERKKEKRNAQELIPLSTIENAIILNRGYLAIVYLETGKLTKKCLVYFSNISKSNIFLFSLWI